jgi:hypothetical protein
MNRTCSLFLKIWGNEFSENVPEARCSNKVERYVHTVAIRTGKLPQSLAHSGNKVAEGPAGPRSGKDERAMG